MLIKCWKFFSGIYHQLKVMRIGFKYQEVLSIQALSHQSWRQGVSPSKAVDRTTHIITPALGEAAPKVLRMSAQLISSDLEGVSRLVSAVYPQCAPSVRDRQIARPRRSASSFLMRKLRWKFIRIKENTGFALKKKLFFFQLISPWWN